jgi:hypothetical protein
VNGKIASLGNLAKLMPQFNLLLAHFCPSGLESHLVGHGLRRAVV